MATYSDGQRRALLNADLERGHLRLTDSVGNRVHGMTLRALLRHGLIDGCKTHRTAQMMNGSHRPLIRQGNGGSVRRAAA